MCCTCVPCHARLVSTRLADKLGTHVSACVAKHPPLFHTHTNPPIIALAPLTLLSQSGSMGIVLSDYYSNRPTAREVTTHDPTARASLLTGLQLGPFLTRNLEVLPYIADFVQVP